MILCTRRSQSGETIIEVLIAIAIIASTLGIAFATTNRATKGIDANKDRYQAQLYANQQADFLLADSMTSGIRRAGPFCITTANTVQTFSGAVPDTCIRDSRYEITITSPATCTSTSVYCTYKVHVEWDSAKGARDSVEVLYGT